MSTSLARRAISHHVDCTCGCRQEADRKALQLLLADREQHPVARPDQLTVAERRICIAIGLALAAVVIVALEVTGRGHALLATVKGLFAW